MSLRKKKDKKIHIILNCNEIIAVVSSIPGMHVDVTDIGEHCRDDKEEDGMYQGLVSGKGVYPTDWMCSL